MGVTFMQTGIFTEATQCFLTALSSVEKLMNNEQQDIEYLYKKYRLDVEKKKDAILLQGLKETILMNMALMQEHRGKFRLAVKLLEDLLKINPLMIEPRLRLVKLFDLLGNIYSLHVFN